MWEATAAKDAHDDALISSSIGYYVAWRQAGGEIEPLGDRRRRKSEESARREASAGSIGHDYRNSAYSADEMGQEEYDEDPHTSTHIY